MAKQNQRQNRPQPSGKNNNRQAPTPAKPQRNNDYDNTNRGVLFKNKKKESDNHPDLKGSFTDMNGNEYWLSAWKRHSDKVGDYFSIAAQPKDEPAPEHGGTDDDLFS